MRVLIADDNAIVRLGVRAILEQVSDVCEVVEAADGIDALAVARDSAPDIVLLDVRMPRMSGLDVLPELASIAPVLMLTHSEEPEIIQAALGAGARGYLVHGSTSVDELEGALRTCRSGGMVLGKQAAEWISASGPTTAAVEPTNPLREKLTAREAEVLDSAALGLDNAEIAAEQFLAPRTVKNYLNSAYSKLGVHTRSAAIVVWLEAGEE